MVVSVSRTGLPRRRASPLAVPANATSSVAAPVDDTPGHAVARRSSAGRLDVARGGSGAEAALALGVRPQRAQEVDAAEVGPVGLAEVELAVRALPEQEAAEPLLARGADHQVGVGLALGVEVLGDVLDVEDLGELLDRGALGGVLLQQRPYGVGDLAPPAVADGDVDDAARRRRAVASAASLSRRAVSRGQQVERADRVQPPAPLRREVGDRVLDDPSSRPELAPAAG